MARTRTTKKLAQRIDLNYFKRPTPFKRARLWLVVIAVLLAVGWLGWKAFVKDSRVYSSGRMSGAHAVLEKQCAACHVQKAGEFSSKAADNACLGCHDGPVHHENAVKTQVPECAGCHVEHRGRINISAASNKSCAGCHGDLRSSDGQTKYAKNIQSLEDGHPEVRVLRERVKDPGTILLNHYLHMQPIRRGPTGPIVQMECGDCHRGAAQTAAWPYADARYVTASVTYNEQEELLPVSTGTLKPRKGGQGREYLEPVKFATACAACHLLTFDKRFDEGVPHDKPEVVHAFVMKKFQEYIAAHPTETRVVREPGRSLPGCPVVPEVRVLTAAEWAKEKTEAAEFLLWNKTCRQCHAMSGAGLLDEKQAAALAKEMKGEGYKNCEKTAVVEGTPQVEPARTAKRWMPHARFDHDAHRGFSCTGCHSAALTSKESSEVMVPGIENCKTCHAPGAGHAESRCFECHTYHDWAKRKEVKPTYTVPGLVRGGK